MDQQAKLAVKINATVMLILKTQKDQISGRQALKSIKDEKNNDAYLLQSRNDF